MPVPEIEEPISSCISSPTTASGHPSYYFSPACQQNFVNSALYGSYPQYSPWRMPYQYPFDPYQNVASEYQSASFVHFISGNISTCFGCRNSLKKFQDPPADLCIQHQDWRDYIAPNTGISQAKYGNVYYHCRPECVKLRHANFLPSTLLVPQDIVEKLSSVHKNYLCATFGLTV